MNEKKLVRSQTDRMFMGVAGGIAEYMNLDPVLVRLVFVLLTLFGGHGLLIYLIMAIIMPDESIPAPKAQAFDEEEIVVKGA